MQENELILSLKGISKKFPGVLALDQVNFELRRGEVHALIGENGAGKSTLMKILLGIYRPDGGTIIYKGEQTSFSSPHDALSNGICMIHQEVCLVPTVTAADNIWMGRENNFKTGGLLNKKSMIAATRKLLDKWDIQLDCTKLTSTMSMAEMQMVEIARAVSYNADVVIRDEPTSSLAEAEVQVLYRIIHELSAKGISIIFISHKLEEIFDVCDRVTVFRDGQYIATNNTGDITMDDLVSMIAGREINNLYPKETVELGETVLDVKNLCQKGVFHDVSFQLRKGEILGFCGLVGAGRTEIMNAIFGITKPTSGEIWIKGEKVHIESPQDAIKYKIGMITEDRLHLGILPLMSVKMNMTLAGLKKLVNKAGMISAGKEQKEAEQLIQTMGVKTPTTKQLISTLSGGNQQKAILARWLFTGPEILIMDEPTRGIDVGSKSEIHRHISQLAKGGMSIILISSELPEVMGMSDRILVVCDGTIVSQYERGTVGQEQLIKDAFGAE